LRYIDALCAILRDNLQRLHLNRWIDKNDGAIVNMIADISNRTTGLTSPIQARRAAAC
jgi:hypothetical protein